jgi:lysophospholipase L1-like esterase
MSDRWHYVYHSLLGHVPKPGLCRSGSANSTVTIDGNGLRSTGERTSSDDGSVLAVGDSFTYGEEVSDSETWPAHFQRLTGRRVLNGGVSGYGFDQIVLRAEQLAAAHAPSIIVVSFIADDLRRMEMRRLWWRNKPWFAIEDDRVVLKGVPVPTRTRLPFQIRHRMEQVLIELPPILQQLAGYHARVHRVGLGVVIAQRLTERLARLQAERSARVILMAQYPSQVWVNRSFADEQRRMTQAVLDSAATNGLAILDTFRRLAAEPKPSTFYARSHMNERGNQMIASLLAVTLPVLLKSSSP